MTTRDHIERLETLEPELGATDAVRRHVSRKVVEPKGVSQRKLDFEYTKPRWLREMMAEATGVFFYVYPGIAATTAFLLHGAEPAFGSMFMIGWAYTVGIAFAIISCAPTSGGHFNPAITLCFAYWQGFPWKKVPYYIFAQIFASFMTGLILMGQYHEQMSAFAARSIAEGKGTVYNGGAARILCTFPGETQNNLGYLFLIEFFVDSFIGIVIWATLDSANPFISPASAPLVIGLAYANMVWGFANSSISTNLARDLGTRIVAVIWFGGEAFSHKNYSWIVILANIPAAFFATAYYEMLMRDSLKKIGHGHAVHAAGEEGLQRHLTKVRTGEMENGSTVAARKQEEAGTV